MNQEWVWGEGGRLTWDNFSVFFTLKEFASEPSYISGVKMSLLGKLSDDVTKNYSFWEAFKLLHTFLIECLGINLAY